MRHISKAHSGKQLLQLTIFYYSNAIVFFSSRGAVKLFNVFSYECIFMFELITSPYKCSCLAKKSLLSNTWLKWLNKCSYKNKWHSQHKKCANAKEKPTTYGKWL